ncbi:MAG TPA: choice-of-anchor L domain-containing protein [Kofleriaceae bacterium]
MTFAAFASACGPSSGGQSCPGIDNPDFDNDSSNCGRCGNVCTDGFTCQEGRCLVGECRPGESEQCYDGQPPTRDVGECKGGIRDCDDTGRWSPCNGEVVPTGENGDHSHDGKDNNCNGKVDENEDADGDGLTTWDGDCCDSTECPNPAQIGLGSFDVAGNGFDDDCNGVIDDTPLLCDQGIASNTQNAMDYAKAIDICQVATMADKKWGVITAALTLTDGMNTPDPEGHSVRPKFGSNLSPQGGVNLAILSSGGASAKNDTMPSFHDWVSYTHTATNTAAFPADWLAANNGKVPNAPGCPDPLGSVANDPEMLTLEIRVPTNAKSFRLSTNFYSAEFPEFVCSAFNDFFVVLLDSTYTGTPANPTDKNLAFYTPMSGGHVPVGVNLAGQGLFTQCKNGDLCGGLSSGTITSCVGVDQLAGTGMDDPDYGCGDTLSASTVGGATGWLVTAGNVTPGEIIKLRIAVWDTSDHAYDSAAVIDGFQWSIDTTNPGTVIFKDKPGLAPLPVDAKVTSNRNSSRLLASPMAN